MHAAAPWRSAPLLGIAWDSDVRPRTSPPPLTGKQRVDLTVIAWPSNGKLAAQATSVSPLGTHLSHLSHSAASTRAAASPDTSHSAPPSPSRRSEAPMWSWASAALLYGRSVRSGRAGCLMAALRLPPSAFGAAHKLEQVAPVRAPARPAAWAPSD